MTTIARERALVLAGGLIRQTMRAHHFGRRAERSSRLRVGDAADPSAPREITR
jgi:hypothetical protein